MKKRILVSVICIFIFKIGFSQDANSARHEYAGLPSDIASYVSDYDTNVKGRFDQTYKNLAGSVYINEDFSKAKLTGYDPSFQMRYDAYSDEMEMDTTEDIRYLLKKPKMEVSFLNNNKTYGLYSTNENNNGFFVIILKGDKFSLLLKEKVIFIDETVAETGYEKYVPPTLKHVQDKLYIGYSNNTANEFPQKKKEILALFSSKSKEVEKYAKEQELGFKNTEDIIQIFKHYSTL